MAGLKVLYLMNGYGFGNLTRSIPIIESLEAAQFKVDIVTSMRNKALLRANLYSNQIFEMNQHSYSDLQLPGKRFFGKFVKNLKLIKSLIEESEYSLVITDSVYEVFFVNLKIPLVSINNIHFSKTKVNKKTVARSNFSSIILEFCDEWLLRKLPDLTISPSFKSRVHRETHGVKFVEPIVRKCSHVENNIDDIGVLYMPSGGDKEVQDRMEILLEQHFPNNCTVLGGSGRSKRLVYKKPSLKNYSLMRRAKALVTNTGFMSTTELIYLKKPFLAVPLKGHFEQNLNSNVLREFTSGIVSSYANLDQDLEALKERDQGSIEVTYSGGFDGATQAASLIGEMIGS